MIPHGYMAMERSESSSKHLIGLVEQIVESYHAHSTIQHLDSTFLPSRTKTIELTELLRRLMFPVF